MKKFPAILFALCMLLALCLTFALLPATASAAGINPAQSYNLHGQQYTNNQPCRHSGGIKERAG